MQKTKNAGNTEDLHMVKRDKIAGQAENSLLYKWEVMSNTEDHLHSCCNKFVEWDKTYM